MKMFPTILNISYVVLIFCNCFGFGTGQLENSSPVFENAKAIQQSVQQLKEKVDKTAEIYRSLLQEKLRLTESNKRLQIKIRDLTKLGTCIDNCSTTTIASSESTQNVNSGSTSSLTSITESATFTTPSAQCLTNPCQNGGTCQPNDQSYSCLCSLGYVGKNCETYDCYQQFQTDSNSIQIISSPAYSTGAYPNLWSCVFSNLTFDMTGDGHVWLNFMEDFSLEQDLNICQSVDGCCDYVAVYDGPDTNSPLIGRYCGNSVPTPSAIYSTSTSLTVEFYSDMSTHGKGFAAYIGRAIPNDTCNGASCTDDQFCFQSDSGSMCQSPCDLQPCMNVGTCTNVNASFSCMCQQVNTGTRCDGVADAALFDCQYAPLLYNRNNRPDGIYTVYPDGVTPVQVLCETIGPDTWTVLMNRVDGMDFNRSWSEYVSGFGFANSTYWVGLDNIYKFVSNKRYSIRFDMTDCDGNSVFAENVLFNISNSDGNYAFVDAGYDSQNINGNDNANDGMSPFGGSSTFNLVGQPFSTYDNNNNADGMNCGALYGSGWWWGQCYSFMSNPMGKWYPDCKADVLNGGIQWNTWKDSSYSLYRSSIKILRQHF